MIEAGLSRGAVYVHCWGGIGRTGSVIGCVLVDEGLGCDEIIDRLTTLRHGSRKAHRRAPEMPVQHDLLRRRVRPTNGPLRVTGLGCCRAR
jgi:protein-tyrosine phosphatase